ncbi:MAG: hypothetical protein IPG50_16750 [Myxococcales bacterium]|nr:hypothetical protein [Myxococcales bacterium]
MAWRARRGLLVGCTALAAVGSLWACLRPTQITLRVTTDVPCDQIAESGVSIWNGTGLRDAVPLTSTRDCTGGAPIATVGTLVIAPSGSRSDEITVTAVAGVSRKSEECAAAAFEGCIVARRRLRYVEHTPLELPVLLSRSCLDVVCGEGETCAPCTGVGCKPRCAPLDAPDACDAPEARCTAPRSDSGALSLGQDSGTPVATVDASAPADAGADLPVPRVLVSEPGTAFYGLAELADTLYWTEEPLGGTVSFLRFGALAPLLANPTGVSSVEAGTEQKLLTPPYRGLDAVHESQKEVRVVVGATLPPASNSPCGITFLATDGGFPIPQKLADCTEGLFGMATGLAFFPGSRTDGVATTSSGIRSVGRFALDGGGAVMADAAPPTGYARRVGDGVAYTAGATVQLVPPTGKPTQRYAGPAGMKMLAAAESPGGVRYVTVDTAGASGPTVFVQRPNGAWFPAASLAGAEDILVVPVSASSGVSRLVHVLVAARGAIWIFENVADP